MKVLVVDDEDINLEIINNYLTEDGYEVVTSKNGEEGFERLYENLDVSIILLDRTMPKMDGLEFLAKFKRDKKVSHIPVVMQTAVADNDSVAEGISAGAYYYLTKPYTKNVLLSIMRAALADASYKSQIIDEIRKNRKTLGFLNNAQFELRTMDEAQYLAYFMAGCFPEPEKVVLGLSEILLNAVEHGNLGISYSEKCALMYSGKLQAEIDRRENLPENQQKKIHVSFERNAKETKVVVKDEGAGFNWKDFIEMDPSRMTDPNGRGILMARTLSFDKVVYKGCGNEVCCSVFL